MITVLTGITQSMVAPAPTIDEVIETFLDFVGDSVIVGHNVRFDLRFLNGALRDNGFETFRNVVVDTCSLARRLVRDEVRNCKLHTLSEYFRLRHQPSHRALDDARATGELLHILIERATGLGVTGLTELVALPTIGAHPDLAKFALTNNLPRSPGIYVFRNANSDVLYVGKAINIRQRVRSYFTGDDRRKVGRLLHEVTRIDAEKSLNDFAAGVREIRMIHEHEPHYNRQVKNWRKYAYVALTLEEKYPRLVVARSVTRDDRLLIGPLSSKSQAEDVIDALHAASRLRRCNRVPHGKRTVTPCLSAQLGVTDCPCKGDVSVEQYAETVQGFIDTLVNSPHDFIASLVARMSELAQTERFEDAAMARDRADLLSRILSRQHQVFALRREGRVVLRAADKTFVTIEHGRVIDVALNEPSRLPHTCDDNCPSPLFIHPRDVDELIYTVRHLEKYRHSTEVVFASTDWQLPAPLLPRFAPRTETIPSSVTRRYVDAVA